MINLWISVCAIFLQLDLFGVIMFLKQSQHFFCVMFCFVRSRKSMEHTKRCAFARKTSIIIIIFVLALRKRTKLSITSVKLIEIIDVLMCSLFLDLPISLCRHISIIVIHNFTRLISVNTISVCSTEILN